MIVIPSKLWGFSDRIIQTLLGNSVRRGEIGQGIMILMREKTLK